MDMKTFKLALRRAWLPALLLFVAALFGSFVYVQKRVPPTAKASIAVRDALTINGGASKAAQVSFDAIVKSDRLAENVQRAMGSGASSVRGALSVEVVIPSNGINISPLYVVRAQDPDPQRALVMVRTAVKEATKLYASLNKVDPSQLASVDKQRAAARTRLANATKAFNNFNNAHGGDVGTQLSLLRSQIGALDDRVSQAQADLASAERLSDAAARSAAAARVTEYTSQRRLAQSQLAPLGPLEPTYQNLASDLTQARTSVQQLGAVRQALVSNLALPVGDQIKVLDGAALESKALMKILVYMLGIIVGLLAAMGAVYVEANRLRNREGTEDVIAALGAPALGRIPRRAVVEVR